MWKDEIRHNVTSLGDLPFSLPLTKKEHEQLEGLIQRHPMSITRHYLSLINGEDADDPLKKIIVPSLDELDLAGSYDTSGEKRHTKLLGVQHKYAQTALVLATNRCASYCRFCFRKRLVGVGNREVLEQFSHAVEYIREHPEVNNVLITGGDPMMLDTPVLAEMLHALSDISHVDFVRIGSKMPVFLPQRFLHDAQLLKMFREINNGSYRLYLVSHIDHPQEISAQTQQAVDALLASGVIISNQTVLMRGINDTADVLAHLQNMLTSIGITPYYVFQCRPVKRVKKRFQIPLVEGVKIVELAKAQMNGHSKRFKYAMSHKTGKIEILGVIDDEIYFKYHQAHDPRNLGKIFKRPIDPQAAWLDDFKQQGQTRSV